MSERRTIRRPTRTAISSSSANYAAPTHRRPVGSATDTGPPPSGREEAQFHAADTVSVLDSRQRVKRSIEVSDTDHHLAINQHHDHALCEDASYSDFSDTSLFRGYASVGLSDVEISMSEEDEPPPKKKPNMANSPALPEGIPSSSSKTLLQSGQQPTVLQQLVTLPFDYFCDHLYSDVLFPTLFVCSFNNPTNRAIVENELSFSHLEDYINSERGRRNKMIELFYKLQDINM